MASQLRTSTPLLQPAAKNPTPFGAERPTATRRCAPTTPQQGPGAHLGPAHLIWYAHPFKNNLHQQLGLFIICTNVSLSTFPICPLSPRNNSSTFGCAPAAQIFENVRDFGSGAYVRLASLRSWHATTNAMLGCQDLSIRHRSGATFIDELADDEWISLLTSVEPNDSRSVGQPDQWNGSRSQRSYGQQVDGHLQSSATSITTSSSKTSNESDSYYATSQCFTCLKFHLVSTRSVSAIRIILIKQLRRLSESFIKCHRVSNMITSGSKSGGRG